MSIDAKSFGVRPLWTQDEIQQLLMGESLYGDPGLCIRELLQNALDALELRELRLKMKQKGETGAPANSGLIHPGWVREPMAARRNCESRWTGALPRRPATSGCP